MGNLYNFDQNWYQKDRSDPNALNPSISNMAIAKTPLPLATCPSAPPHQEPSRTDGQGSPADYAICTSFGLTGKAMAEVLLPANIKRQDWSTMLNNWVTDPATSKSTMIDVKFKDITDGTSQSIMIIECGGRPTFYRNGVPSNTDAAKGEVTETITGAGWADVDNFFVVHDHCGTNMTNCHNNNEIYSFHMGGCNYTMGDGAVRFIQENIEPNLFVSLMTRAGDDVVQSDF